MPKFQVHITRSVLQWEDALIEVEAESAQAARLLTEQQLDEGDLDSGELNWTSGYSETQDYPAVEGVEEAE